MMPDLTEELAHLTGVIRDGEAARMRRLAEEEARIRTDLAALDADRREVQALPADALAASHSVGADMLWQAWIGRRREDLQMRLARVLARKGVAMRGLQVAHGRCKAAASLHERARNGRAEKREKARIMQEQSLFFFSPASGAMRLTDDGE